MAQPVRIILRDCKKIKSGEMPLYLRVTSGRRTFFLSLGYSILKEYWDRINMRVKKSHPNHQRFNTFLSKKVSEVEALLLESEIKFKKINLEFVKDRLKGKDYTNFFTYAEAQIEKSKGKEKEGTINNYKTALSKLYLFHGSKQLSIDEVTVSFLERYEMFLRDKVGNKINTVYSSIKVIRRFIRQAVKEKLLSPEDNPFIIFKLRKERSTRVALTEEEIHKIESLVLPKTRIYDVRNLFIFSYLSAGSRVGDLLQLRYKNISEGKLHLTTQKTGKILGIKLSPKALAIINYYRTTESKPDDFIFPFLDSGCDYSDPYVLHRTISAKTSLANNHLIEIAKRANINKKLTNHIARHSFASISLKKEVPIKAIADLMGHSSVRTTEEYAKYDNSVLDSYMEKFNN